MQEIWDKYKLWICLGVAAVAVLVFAVPRARAEGISGAPSSIAGPVSFLGTGTFSGIGVEAYGSWVNADTDTSPISLGSTAYTVGGALSAGMQFGSIVVEGFGEYGFVYGDLRDIGGVDRQYAAGGRLGYLVNPQTMIYAVGAKSWIETDAGTVDGWQYGGGVQYRIGNSQWFGRAEYRHGEYDTKDILCVDAVTDTVTVGLTYKFPVK